MRFVSWNVNGLRACMNKGFADYFHRMDADLFAIQETKMQEDQKSFAFEGYLEYWNSAEKKGYSGTLIYAKTKPLSVFYGLEDGKYNDEGRVITLEYPTYYFVTAYVPNSQDGLKRIPYRMTFEDDMRAYLTHLDRIKPVVYCGDLNVAHQPMDLKNPKQNEQTAGYSIEERTAYATLLDQGFADTFRRLHPDRIAYTWWSYMMNARMTNAGWRIDYFLVSERLMGLVETAEIHDQIEGSDHCPVLLEIKI